MGVLVESVGFALPGFGVAPGAGSVGSGDGPAGLLAAGVNGVSPLPGVKV